MQRLLELERLAAQQQVGLAGSITSAAPHSATHLARVGAEQQQVQAQQRERPGLGSGGGHQGEVQPDPSVTSKGRKGRKKGDCVVS